MKINLDLKNAIPEREAKTDILPAGKYRSKIIEVEAKETKTGGTYLALYFEVMAGVELGKVFCDRLNLINSSAEAVRIAESRLKGLLVKANYPNPDFLADTDECQSMCISCKHKYQMSRRDIKRLYDANYREENREHLLIADSNGSLDLIIPPASLVISAHRPPLSSACIPLRSMPVFG